MLKVFLTPRAKLDLEEIWHYTFVTWSSQQADKYLDEIDRAFKRLSRDIHLGISIDDVRTGYLKFRCQRHLILFRIREDVKKIIVVRVLHEAMDIGRHLPG